MRKWIDPIAMILVALAVTATVGCPAKESARQADRSERRPAGSTPAVSTDRTATAAKVGTEFLR